MTGRGIALLGTCALMLLLGLATGIREIYLVLFMLLALLLLSFVATLAAACTARCHTSLSAYSAVRGESVRFQTDVRGFALLPTLVRIRMEFPGSDPLPPDYSLMQRRDYTTALLFGRCGRSVAIRLGCPHRGVWSTGIVRLRVHDLFGFFSLPFFRQRDLAALGRTLTVYPLLYELEEITAAATASLEYSETNYDISDHGDSFAGTRQYRDGDSLKRIHWKQSVRTRELYTRQYELSTEQYTLVLLDTAALSQAHLPGYADMACECAAALGMVYTDGRQRVRLLCVGGREETDITVGGPEDFSTLYASLATLPFRVEQGPLDLSGMSMAELGAVRSIYVVTCRPSEALFDTLRMFAARRCTVSCISPYTQNQTEDDIRHITIARPEEIASTLGRCL